MDYRTLRDELQAGSRLPSPTYGTPKMSHLIQTCWLADPIERPSFTKIKNQLHQSSDVSTYDVDRKNNDYLTLLSDDTMYIQYKMIQESNPMFKQQEDETNEYRESENPDASAEPPSCGTYPYLEISRSERTTVTDLGSTPAHKNNILNYDTPRTLKAQCNAEEGCPLLRKSDPTNDVKNVEMFMGQDSIDSSDYFPINDPPKTSSQEEGHQENECSATVN